MRNILIALLLGFFISNNTKSQCISNFTYNINGNAVYFLDMSFTQQGNIISWYWEFGDGFYSYDQHPIHLYDSLGAYNVCLTISTDNYCTQTFCDTVLIAGCFADYLYTDSNCTYFFTENSQSTSQIVSYYWDFDDGTTSTIQNPTHTFAQSGTYNVQHIIMSQDSCIDTVSYMLQVQGCFNNYQISGNIFAGQNLLPNGIVILINDAGKAIDYTQINQGYYLFDSLNQENYTLFAIPDFDISQVYFPKYFPTYSGDDSFWQNSQSVFVNSVVSKDIHLTKNSDIFYGEGKISGYVTYTSTSGFESNIFSQNLFNKNTNTNIVANYPVLLLDDTHKIIDFTITDFSGNFSFTDLDTGNYVIYVDKYGKTTDDVIVNLTSKNLEIKDIHIIIGQNQVTDIDTKTPEIFNDILLFPNPVNEYLNIKYFNEIRNLELKNYLGQTVLNKQINNNSARINIKNLPSGLYLLTIKLPDNKIIVKKIIKN